MANPFRRLMGVLARATQADLRAQVQFLKAENRMLRERLPAKVPRTEPERRRLVRLGSSLGLVFREIVTIVKYETYRRWKRAVNSRKAAPKRKPGPSRPPKAENLRELVARLSSVRRECLDHFIAFGERPLRHLPRQYVDH